MQIFNYIRIVPELNIFFLTGLIKLEMLIGVGDTIYYSNFNLSINFFIAKKL